MITRRLLLTGAAATALVSRTLIQSSQEVGMQNCDVVELRQYTLHGGKRDTLISLFENHFIEPQNAVGAHVLGTFRDLDDPDRFVWMQGFRDMPAREQALKAFYGGPVWKAHRETANATMLDSDNVLLLRPALSAQDLPQRSLKSQTGGVYGTMIFYLGEVQLSSFTEFFERNISPRIAASGTHPVTSLVTEEAANNFPGLPVRQHERVFLWFARWPSLPELDAFVGQLHTWSGWRDSAPVTVLPALMRKPEVLRLIPTRSSAMQ